MLSGLIQLPGKILSLFTVTMTLMLIACGGSSNPSAISTDPNSLPPNVSAALAQSGLDISASTGTNTENSGALYAIHPASGELDEQGTIRLVFTNPVDSELTPPRMIQLYNETRAQFVDIQLAFNGHEVTVVTTSPPFEMDQYVLIIHAGIELTDGSQLHESYWADFYRLPPEPLTIMNSPAAYVLDRPSTDLQFIFNNQIDPSTLAENVTFFDVTSNTPEDFEFRQDPGQHGFFINPAFSLNAGHTYELKIKAGLRDISGRTLDSDFVKRYQVADGPFHPVIDLSSPAGGQQDFDPTSDIVIQFSETMDPSSVDVDHNYIRTFYGTENYLPSTAYIEGNKLFIVPLSPLEYDRTYKIELPYLHPNWLVATNGYQLAGLHTISFRTIKGAE